MCAFHVLDMQTPMKTWLTAITMAHSRRSLVACASMLLLCLQFSARVNAFQASTRPLRTNEQSAEKPLIPPDEVETGPVRLFRPEERVIDSADDQRERHRPSSGRNRQLSQPVPGGEGERNPAGADLPSDLKIPFANEPLPARSTISSSGKNVTLIIRKAKLSAVLEGMAEKLGLNVVTAGDVTGELSITLNNVHYEDALDAILSVNGYRWVRRTVRQKEIIMVSKLSSETKLSPHVQGRGIRVFRLSFVSAIDIDKTVKGLLSAVGQSYITEVDSKDKRKTREELVVEDLPEYLDRVQEYVEQADRPPAQVLIEAYVLQVKLKDDNRHGVELENLTSLVGGDVTVQANGIANVNSSPAFIVNLNGRRLGAVVEFIKETTDAKTLASPKVLAVNGQQARIQIGESLGYLTTTTTQTSTLQQVNFLDLGVVLTATPVISHDGQILMTVKPEVSSGRINPTTGLPDSDTTEVESTVLMPSGHAMVIGGLITEEDSDQQAKVPILGDVPGLGKLFQRRQKLKDRSEIIIALVPRIVPYNHLAQHKHAQEVHRATTPLLYGPLTSTDRRCLEPALPNASRECDPYGKRMECFPVPPVAYSPQHLLERGVPYLPPASQKVESIRVSPPERAMRIDQPDPEPTELQPQPLIRQTSFERVESESDVSLFGRVKSLFRREPKPQAQKSSIFGRIPRFNWRWR